MKGEKRKQHTEEFKQEAVRLVTEEGYATAEAARNLGINANMLGRWKRELQEAEGFGGMGQLRQMKDELRRLRRENKQLQMEREILKKAAAFFAKESK